MIMYPPLKVKKLFPDAVLPVRANPTDSGLDVYAYRFDKLFSKAWDQIAIKDNPLIMTLAPHERLLVHTGLSATVGSGYEIQVRPRSGNALNRGLIVVNSPGTIDESYRGPICVIISNVGYESQDIKIGEKIAQFVVCPVILSEVQEVSELDDTARGAGGFGSTGK
jgi:dUTP pyrophosphatase